MTMAFSTLILAAGAGTRMRSTRAKVAHELLGKPMIRWVVDAARMAGSERVITVVGCAREQVIPLVERDTTVVVQEEQLGTGHAIMIARDLLAPIAGATATPLGSPATPGASPTSPTPTSSAPAPGATPPPTSLVVLCGDTPLITPETIGAMVATQRESGAAACLLTHIPDDPTGYGRVIRDERGEVIRIVEEKEAAPQERIVRECNSGAYCFDLPLLLENLRELNTGNTQGEYYLTDVIGICVSKGLGVRAYTVDAEETQGINNRAQLARATKSMQRRVNIAHMMAGVTMLDPDLVWIGPDVALEPDVELLPMTLLLGKTSVGSGSVLGPNTRVTDSCVGRDCRVDESVLLGVTLEDGVSCGPRAYLRPGTVMKAGSKAGTHVEIKNSTVGPNSKVPHLSYLGDTTLGKDVNIGAGTITCNYDGFAKNPTTIGDHAFIGSSTMFVAPVSVGEDAATGAGSVITKDVPAGALGIERTAQTIEKGWTRKHRASRDEKAGSGETVIKEHETSETNQHEEEASQ
jgi:bifunctional UDP-N-acetylglucosamine pyrophosphorylase/glucosamine-1-phosphate N-acetyltransferase